MKIVKKLKSYVFSSSDRYFLFTDGSLRNQSLKDEFIGLGADLRDSNGNKVLFYSEQIKTNNLPENFRKDDFEKLALHNALNICLEQGITNIVVNTDDLSMSNKINQCMEKHELGKINDLENITKSLRSDLLSVFNVAKKFESFFIEHISRDLNTSADYYSRMEHADNKNAKTKKNNNKNNHNLPIILAEHGGHLAFSLKSKIVDKQQLVACTDLIEKSQFAFDVYLKDVASGKVSKDLYKKIVVNYNEDNKALVLGFVLSNLVTKKSSLPLLHYINNDEKVFNFNYSNKLWETFSPLKASEKEKLNIPLLKITNEIWSCYQSLKKFNLKGVEPAIAKHLRDVLFSNMPSFYAVYTNSQGVFFNDPSMKKKTPTIKIEENKVKVEKKIDKMIQKQEVKKFSFLEYGKSLQNKI